mmetsp:Transcript_82869/g.221442  ORF Transcript_82869/g.221442 Transcript_82869/m.221442 type:complete len:92 (-) Transcript_82869:101-376(-)
MPGMLVAPSFFSVDVNLASVWAEFDRVATFFLRRTEPFPPVEVEAPPNRLAIIFSRAAAISSVMVLGLVWTMRVYYTTNKYQICLLPQALQ